MKRFNDLLDVALYYTYRGFFAGLGLALAFATMGALKISLTL